MKERPYQKLIVWKEAHSLCLWIYGITKQFPGDERFRLVDQMCRAASSVPMNIAEGSGKSSNKERARYYETALCSLEEVHYQCVLARDLQYMKGEQFDDADDRIQRVSFLARKLRSACF
ncbi:MAG: four helix bundle protein [Candidatus Peribacteraceae bacterium]|nr:four helix bundle protein [Candidatus Peribacteraceae bacterium]